MYFHDTTRTKMPLGLTVSKM